MGKNRIGHWPLCGRDGQYVRCLCVQRHLKNAGWVNLLVWETAHSAPDMGHWCPCWAQLWETIFMMVCTPLLTWGKLTNSRNTYRLWERLRQREKLKSQKPIPIGYKGSNRSNPEINVVWSHCCQDTTRKDRLATQPYVDWHVESLKIWTTGYTCHTCFPSSLFLPHTCFSSLRGYSPIWGACLPHPRYSMQAKLASRWGPLEATGGFILSSLFTSSPRNKQKVMVLVDTGAECTLSNTE